MLYITFLVGSGIKSLVRGTWVLRFVAHAVLFGLMVQVIADREYYVADVRPECDQICQDRGVGLLKVALSGIQCLSICDVVVCVACVARVAHYSDCLEFFCIGRGWRL